MNPSLHSTADNIILVNMPNCTIEKHKRDYCQLEVRHEAPGIET